MVSNVVILFVLCFVVDSYSFLTPYCSHGEPLHDVFCGRGPTRQDCPEGYTCHVHPADAWAVCCPIGTRAKRSNPQLDKLRNKLSNLQDLLQEMEKDEEKSITTLSPTTKQDEINKGKESRMVNPKTTDNDKTKDQLSSDEIAILKALQNSLNRQQEQSRLKQELENEDKPVLDKNADDVSVLKALASKLSRNEQSQSESGSPYDTDSLSLNKGQQQKEAKFTLFRQEVLAQIEDRLLQDIDFALKTGFTVEEILNDLQEKEERFKELQLEMMKNRLEGLRKIRD